MCGKSCNKRWKPNLIKEMHYFQEKLNEKKINNYNSLKKIKVHIL